MSYSSIPPIPEEFRVLSMMNNIGAVTPEKSLTLEELTMWTGFDSSDLRHHLKGLIEQGYVEQVQVQGAERYHITKVGIIKVLSMYS
jgi:DNA-binding MarR family transcriptional regulator